MPTFPAADGTELAYYVSGEGAPLVCVPGGPMRASAYLGDLGGLSAHKQLIMLDLRGTGKSAIPADPGSYRSDRLAEDVSALQEHLGLGRFDLLGHSAVTAFLDGEP
jgi:proline iminopeptidase